MKPFVIIINRDFIQRFIYETLLAIYLSRSVSWFLFCCESHIIIIKQKTEWKVFDEYNLGNNGLDFVIIIYLRQTYELGISCVLSLGFGLDS